MTETMTQTVQRGRNAQMHALAGRQILLLAAVCGLVWLLHDRFSHIDLGDVRQAVIAVNPAQWMLAALATAASFWAVGRYDAVIHGVLGTGIAPGTARRGGIVAIAAAQFAGCGVLTGALVRWRMIWGFSLWQATRLSLVVSGSFLAAWLVFSAAVVWITPVGFGPLHWAPPLILAAALLAVALSLWQPRCLPRLPTVRAMGAILALVIIDTSFAGLAFWVLLPADLGLTATSFAPVFLIALGAGLVGGTPGGVGPFELTLLALLPIFPPDPLLGTALAFRLVYYVFPALVAVLFLLRGDCAEDANPPLDLTGPFPKTVLGTALESAIWNAPMAEAQLLRQGELSLLTDCAGTSALAGITGQSLVLVRDPLEAQTAAVAVLDLAWTAARKRHLMPVLYKCGQHQAMAARRCGWSVLHVSDEALLDPSLFDLGSPACRQLRRVLRKADSEGVIVTAAGPALPLTEMAEIASEWAQANGGERGFVMGRFDPAIVATQKVFLAHADGSLVAFVSFNEVAAEWSLDLMRQGAAAPDGTMHALVAHAIHQAAVCGLRQISLASVPNVTAVGSGLPTFVQRRLADATGGSGLRRFKSSFAPRWVPRYAAAPSRIALAIGLVETTGAINRRARR